MSREEWAVHDAEGVGDIGPHPSTKILNEYLAATHEGLDLEPLEKYGDALPVGLPRPLRRLL